jgi:2,3-bisphosphoglycerate-independent phosphoglycerate mutase
VDRFSAHSPERTTPPTPITVGDHSGEPCPIFFWGHGVRPDGCTAFGERAVLGGGVGRIRGLDVMNIMTSYMGVQEKFGA